MNAMETGMQELLLANLIILSIYLLEEKMITSEKNSTKRSVGNDLKRVNWDPK